MLELSDTTRAYLDGVCFASNFFWTDGGMGYQVITSSDSVDCKAENREKIRSEKTPDFNAEPHNQLAKLCWFLHCAFGGGWDEELKKYLPISRVNETFLSRINADIRADWFTAELEENDYGMDIRLLLADANDQVLCLLEMAWRID